MMSAVIRFHLSAVGRYLARRHLFVLLDAFDALCMLVVRLIAPPKANAWNQALRAGVILFVLTLVAHLCAWRGGDWTIAGTAIAGFIMFCSIAYIRAGLVCDSAFEHLLSHHGSRLPVLNHVIPDCDVAIAVAGVFLIIASPVLLYYLDQLQLISLLAPPDGHEAWRAVLYVGDQVMGAATLDIPEIYDFSFSGIEGHSLIDRHVTFGLRMLLSAVGVVAILRMTPIGAQKGQERMAMANLRYDPVFAVMMGRRIVGQLRRYALSRPGVDYRDFIARHNALIAYARVEGDRSIPFLESLLQEPTMRGAATEAMVNMRSVPALKCLLKHTELWQEGAPMRQSPISSVGSGETDRPPLLMRLVGFARAINDAQDSGLVGELMRFYKLWDAPPSDRAVLLRLIGAAAGRFWNVPHSGKTFLESIASEAGYDSGKQLREQWALGVPQLSQFLRGEVYAPHNIAEIQFWAFSALDWIGSPDDVGLFRELMKPDVDSALRLRALIAYARCNAHGLEAGPIIAIRAQLASKVERWAAAWALGEIRDPAGADMLFEWLEDTLREKHDLTLHNHLIEVIAKLGPDAQRRLLAMVAQDRETWTKQFIVRCVLGEAPDLLMAFAVELLSEADFEVAGEAARAGRIDGSLNAEGRKAVQGLPHRVAMEFEPKLVANRGNATILLQYAEAMMRLFDAQAGDSPSAERTGAEELINKYRGPMRGHRARQHHEMGAMIDVGRKGATRVWDHALDAIGRNEDWKLGLMGAEPKVQS